MRIEKNIDVGNGRFIVEVRRADGTREKAKTKELPLFNGEWTNLLLQFTDAPSEGRKEIILFVKQRSPFGNIKFEDQISLNVDIQVLRSFLNTDFAYLGGVSQQRPFPKGIPFIGDLDQVNLWQNQISEEIFEEHVVAPEKVSGKSNDRVNTEINGNIQVSDSFNKSKKNILYRTEFTDSSKLSEIPNFFNKPSNVTANQASKDNFERYNRINFFDTVQIGNVPFIKNKIRTEENENQTKLYLNQEKGRSFDPVTEDSRKLGIFFSPYTSANRDVISEITIEPINQVLGNPKDQFRQNYNGLDGLRSSYWEKYEEPINTSKYIRLIDEFYDALFNHIRESIPARASYYDGIVIEPTILERDREPIPTGSIQIND